MKILWLGWKDLYATRRMKEAAEKAGVQLDALEIFDISLVSDSRASGIYHGGVNLLDEYDALVVRTFHPYISESLTVARVFRDAGKVVIDRSLTDEGYAISKQHDYILMSQNGLPVPATRQVFNPAEAEAFAREVGYPCVLKGVHGAHGKSVFLVKNEEQLRRWLWRFPIGELAVQEFLPAEIDYRVLTIGYQALPTIICRKPAPGDFRTNFAVNGKFSACSLAEYPELKEISEKAARLLRREFAGVDIRYKGDRPMILEVNRRPAFEGYELTTGYDVAGEFLKYILSKAVG